MTYDVAALREREFPWAASGEHIYLNNASTGPLPQRALEAVRAAAADRARPWRIADSLLFSTLERSRELCARLIGASPDEIALTVNTSHGVNLAARALPLAQGDVVLTFDGEFPANVYPWMALRSRGVHLELIRGRDGLPDEDALVQAIARPEVRAVTVSWVAFASGYRVDLARIGAECRARGIPFVVDAIQGLGAATLDVDRCAIDILACGAQKWLLSPWGSGFVYVRRELVQQLEPPYAGWLAVRGSDDFSRLTDYDLTYLENARRFEVGTLPSQDFIGLNASVELLLELGPAAVAAHVASLADDIVRWAGDRPEMRLLTPADVRRRAGIVAIVPPDPHGVSQRLTRAGVSHALREGAIRLSPHCYNTAEEIARALSTIEGTPG